MGWRREEGRLEEVEEDEEEEESYSESESGSGGRGWELVGPREPRRRVVSGEDIVRGGRSIGESRGFRAMCDSEC